MLRVEKPLGKDGLPPPPEDEPHPPEEKPHLPEEGPLQPTAEEEEEEELLFCPENANADAPQVKKERNCVKNSGGK